MKKIATIILVISILIVSTIGCANSKHLQIEGKEVLAKPVGLATMFGQFDKRVPSVEYRICVGNIVWGLLLSASIVPPVIILGWFLLEPVQVIE